ncbi:MAG: hypothetical protein SFY70_04910 [Bacteroidia bacterium]|nr:hypothetical protein [Bacteroidia bacterium]
MVDPDGGRAIGGELEALDPWGIESNYNNSLGSLIARIATQVLTPLGGHGWYRVGKTFKFNSLYSMVSYLILNGGGTLYNLGNGTFGYEQNSVVGITIRDKTKINGKTKYRIDI